MRSFLHFIDKISQTLHALLDEQSFTDSAVMERVSILRARGLIKTVSNTSLIECTHEHLVLDRCDVCFFALCLAHQQSGDRTW